MTKSSPSILRETDAEARALGRSLVRASPFAALATLGADGFPLATLASVATDADGAPVTLVSRLSGHTANLLENPRLSLLFARHGRGDPLAHPRVSVMGEARIVERDGAEAARIRRRFLARQPKAQLYVDFPDFLFVKVAIRSASLNGGFGKAYELSADDLLTQPSKALEEAEAEILAHMNVDHGDALALYADLARRGSDQRNVEKRSLWRMTGIDADGFEIADGSDVLRLDFPARAETAEAARATLVAMARKAREAES
jgi:putative heme iron utilization protein